MIHTAQSSYFYLRLEKISYENVVFACCIFLVVSVFGPHKTGLIPGNTVNSKC